MENGTSEESLEFMKTNEHRGHSLFFIKDHTRSRGYRKDLIKNLSYNEFLKKADELYTLGDELVIVKFIPYGKDIEIDNDLGKIVVDPMDQISNDLKYKYNIHYS